VFREFAIEDLTCDSSAAYAVDIGGVAADPLRAMTFRPVTVASAQEPLWIRRAEGIHLENVQVNGSWLSSDPAETWADPVKLPIRNRTRYGAIQRAIVSRMTESRARSEAGEPRSR
jgi:hypothetical protein